MTAVTKRPAKQTTRTGIGSRLVAAFLLFAILPLVAAFGGWLNHRVIEAPLRYAAQTNIAFGKANNELTTNVLKLGQIATRNPFRLDPEELKTTTAMATQTLALLNQEIKSLEVLASDKMTLSALQMRFGALNNTIEDYLAAAIKQQNRLSKIENAHAFIRQETTSLDSLLNELLADKTVSSPQSQSVIELRFTVKSLRLLAEEADGATDKDVIARVSEQFSAALRQAILQLTLIDDVTAKSAIAYPLERLYVIGSGSASVFATGRILSDEAAIQRSRQVRIANLSRELLQSSAALQRNNDIATQSTLSATLSALKLSVASLLLVAVICAAAALLILWRYVFRNLIRRLRLLTEATSRISRGELDVDIRISGNDELTALAESLLTFRDNAQGIRARDELLQARATELEAANQELDKFAYVASHDLRSPLRGIDSLASFIQEDLAGKLPPDSARHLDLMRSRITRLEALLESLLLYYRVGRTKEELSTIDIHTFVDECAVLYRDSDHVFEVSGWDGAIATYATPLATVLRNLFDNAIKHHDGQSSRVEINTQLCAGHLTITVSDDGPGIPTEFQSRIFDVFQTLKARDKVEGSGMGLAILRKLVDSYRGDVTVSSDPEKSRGTSFQITWPAHEVRAIQSDKAGQIGCQAAKLALRA